jgi:probable HAF family extracellular repeat protein
MADFHVPATTHARSILVNALACLGLWAGAVYGQSGYRFVALPQFGVQDVALAQSGADVVGYSWGFDGQQHAILWSAGQAIDLGLGEAVAYDVGGHIDGNTPLGAMRWFNGHHIPIPGALYVTAGNFRGAILGRDATGPTVWGDHLRRQVQLEVPDGMRNCIAVGIATGQEVYSGSCREIKGGAGSQSKAIAWIGGPPLVLDDLGEGAEAFAIDNGREVGGMVRTDGGAMHIAAWWDKKHRLNQLDSAFSANVYAMNRTPSFVGDVYTIDNRTGRHAALWLGPDLALTDLNQYIDPAYAQEGWVMETASGISSTGAIIGTMSKDNGASKRAYQLVPTTSLVK